MLQSLSTLGYVCSYDEYLKPTEERICCLADEVVWSFDGDDKYTLIQKYFDRDVKLFAND